MKKNLLNIVLFSLVLGFALVAHKVEATEVLGTLSTGISSTLGTTLNGIVIAPPVASLAAGSYTGAQSVVLTASGASSIHYTNDGTDPLCTTGTVYAGAIAVGSNMTIKALSCYPENRSSAIASYTYTIVTPTPPANNNGGGGGGGGGGGTIVGGSTSSFLKGDINRDGRVDILDFVLLMANWNSTILGNIADVSIDGRVDILDFVVLMANWTK